MSDAFVAVRHQPGRVAGGAAVVFALVAVALVGGPAIYTALAVQAAGVGLLGVGRGLAWRDRRAVGTVFLFGGSTVVLASWAMAAGALGVLPLVLAILPGVVGAGVLAAGVVPAYGDPSRGLVKVGAAGVFVTAVGGALLRLVPFGTTFLVVVGSVLAWDAAEHAINVGEQLGVRAATYRPEGVHVAGSALVGGGSLLGVQVLRSTVSGSASLSALVMAVVSVLLLTAALHG